MKKILFTKELETNRLKEILAENLNFEIHPVLKIETYPTEKFVYKIDKNSNYFLISSQNAVHAISDLNLNGKFYVVGKNTSSALINKGFNVIHHENYADDLADFISNNFQPITWNFFCGNNRRETLFEELVPKGHELNEVICYDSIPVNYKIDSELFDGIVFFSPLAVKTYFSNNLVRKNSVIFSVGKTTEEEIKKHTHNNVVTAEIPVLEKVIEKINEYYDPEK